MSDYFDRLELELRTAVPRAVAHPARRRVRMSVGMPWAAAHPRVGMRRAVAHPARRRVPLSVGGLATAVAVAVSVAVAVVAVALLGHTRDAVRAPSVISAPSASGSRGFPTLQQLLANFAVLRRPQTAADRSWQPKCDCGDTARQLPELTRLVRRLPDGTRIVLSVEPSYFGGRNAALTSSLDVNVLQHHYRVSTNFGPNVNYTLFPLPAPAKGGTTWTSIVPDAVTKVRWTFACGPVIGRCGGRPSLTDDVPVSNNIAVAIVRGTSECHGGARAACRQPVATTWYGAGGRVVARLSRASKSNLLAPPFVSGPLEVGRPPQASALLRGDGIAGVRFGAPPAVVLLGLKLFIGPPASGYERGGTCGLDHELVWTGGADSSMGRTLVLYFRHQRFAGYQYGFVLPRGPSHARREVPLSTDRGLGIGDTLARGRQLYGKAFAISTAQGGSWSVRTPSGLITGFAFGWGLRNRVASIDAGDVGCAALSP